MTLAGVDPERVTPGLLGFLVVFALAIATWLLLRSMNRRLGRVDFEESPENDDAEDRRDDGPV
jgi:hypothetical protein